MSSNSTTRKFLAPEVVQTSGMDCGPASLKCLLEGFNIPVSYGRLREACQTDVDGTSIDALEEIAVKLGLEAEQIMLPVDHITKNGCQVLPAIAVTILPNGSTHFIILWRKIGPYIQIMDPAVGRRWMRAEEVLGSLYVHSMAVPAEDWFEWAKSDDFIGPLEERMRDIGISTTLIETLLQKACESINWQSLAVLDSVVRMVTSIVKMKGINKGSAASRLVEHFSGSPESSVKDIPRELWSVHAIEEDMTLDEMLYLSGAVIVRVSGAKPVIKSNQTSDQPSNEDELSSELAAALEEKPTKPIYELIQLLRKDGLLAPLVLVMTFILASFAVVVEALLLRGLLDIGLELKLPEQRAVAFSVLLVFILILLLLEIPIKSMVFQLGRRLEFRLRLAFLEKIPRLGDRYFHSRPLSDMAERGHSIHAIRELPVLGEFFLRSLFSLIITTAGIIWLDPSSTILALLIAILTIVTPLLLQPSLIAQELRVRTHDGALGRFYLDAMLGLVAIRTHAAERSILSEHESLLVNWAKASRNMQFTAVVAESLQSILGFGLAAWLILNHIFDGSGVGSILLLAYWALSLPVIGQNIALTARQYPAIRNRLLRLMEPLSAPEEECTNQVNDGQQVEEYPVGGVSIEMNNVCVRAGGHDILYDVNLKIKEGSHTAIVGRSGSGKSTLVGLLLGWHKPFKGDVLVNGKLLDTDQMHILRQDIAWVDPSVQIWNRSLLGNLKYGHDYKADTSVSEIIDDAHLINVLQKMPDGLQTLLGEGGGLVSGGEGQRVRIGRGLFRPNAKLVLLDEAFRGLEREKRNELLCRARKTWEKSTLICVTHSIEETKEFDNVIVMDGGGIIEYGNPSELIKNKDSRYLSLLSAEQHVKEELWIDGDWKHMRVTDKHIEFK